MDRFNSSWYWSLQMYNSLRWVHSGMSSETKYSIHILYTCYNIWLLCILRTYNISPSPKCCLGKSNLRWTDRGCPTPHNFPSQSWSKEFFHFPVSERSPGFLHTPTGTRLNMSPKYVPSYGVHIPIILKLSTIFSKIYKLISKIYRRCLIKA